MGRLGEPIGPFPAVTFLCFYISMACHLYTRNGWQVVKLLINVSGGDIRHIILLLYILFIMSLLPLHFTFSPGHGISQTDVLIVNEIRPQSINNNACVICNYDIFIQWTVIFSSHWLLLQEKWAKNVLVANEPIQLTFI